MERGKARHKRVYKKHRAYQLKVTKVTSDFVVMETSDTKRIINAWKRQQNYFLPIIIRTYYHVTFGGIF